MTRVARLLGCTEGRLYTLVLTLSLAVWLTAGTLSAVSNRTATNHREAIPFERLGGRPPDPLMVVAAGHIDAGPGAAPLPPDVIAVASDGRHATSRGFIRLAGDASVLHLDVVPDPALTYGEPAARLELCPITSVWLPRSDGPLKDAPAYDCTVVALGARAADGAWTFDLGRFGDRSNGNGFALVPPESSKAPFQVTFRVGSPPPSG